MSILDIMHDLAANAWTISILGPRHDLTWDVHISRRLHFRQVPPYFASGKASSTDPAYALTRARAKAEADLSAILSLPNPRPTPPPRLTDLLGAVLSPEQSSSTTTSRNLRRFG